MNRIASFIIMLTAVGSAVANVEWIDTSHNFGAFSEDLGAVDAEFKFINKSDKPIRVLDARATCGCTRPEYTHGLIEPGDTGVVKVTYLASGRPGRFSKNIYIKTSAAPSVQQTLVISGVVIGSTATLTSKYPAGVGPLKLAGTSIAFGEVKRGKLKTVFIEGYNQSPDTIVPHLSGLPPYIDYSITPAAVPPGEQVSFAFTLQTLRNSEWGIVSGGVSLHPSQSDTDSLELDYFTIITEDFDRLTPGERLNAPVASIAPQRIDLGEIPFDAEPRKFTFKITNSGKLPLMIRRVQVVDSALSDVKLQTNKIKPGKSADLTMMLTPSNAESDFVNAHVSLIVNDPENPLMVARITAEIIR